MKSNQAGFASIDEYIGTFPKEVQKMLETVRRTIKAAAPKAEEKISYNMPTFILNGKYLIYFAGWKHHISLYPVPVGSDAYNKELSKYAVGKGTLQFPLDKPLPLKLITKIVKLRIEDNLEKAEVKSGKKK